MKSSSAVVNQKYKRTPVDELDIERQDTRDGAEFKAYVRKIKALLIEHPTGLTTRMIHEVLGYDMQKATLAALDNIECERSFSILPTRYYMKGRRPMAKTRAFKNSDLFEAAKRYKGPDTVR